ncbi:hypothetical protein ACFQU2_02765 [Siccirubricoccus deserti]
MQQLREQAAESFRAQGFPTRRAEAWHYTDLRQVADAGFDEPLSILGAAKTLPAPHGAWRAVFQDGRFRDDLSSLDAAPFVAASLAAGLGTLEDRLGALARPAAEPMAALNTMLFEDGLVVTVPAGVAGGVLDLLSSARPPTAPPPSTRAT